MTEAAIGLLIVIIIIFILWLSNDRPPTPRPEDAEKAEVGGIARPKDRGPTPFYRPSFIQERKVVHGVAKSGKRSLASFYNFRGIVSPHDVVRMKEGVTELDLHGLRVWEAKEVTLMFLKQARVRSSRVRVITGRGLHSCGGTPKIKPEVETLLRNNGYKFKEIYEGGCLEVKL